MSWQIHVPLRDSHESLIDVASHCRHLGDEGAVMREIVFDAQIDRGLKTAGDLLDDLERMDPPNRRALLDQARVKAGLPTTAEVDAQRRDSTLSVRTVDEPPMPMCAASECTNVPVRNGGFYVPDARRWHCQAHEHLAEPGDMDPPGSGLRYGENGVIRPIDPDDDAAERTSIESDRRQREDREAERAIEAAARDEHRQARDEHRQARDEQLRRELPAHLRGIAA